MHTPQLGLLAWLAAMAALGPTLLGACGGSARGFALAAASVTASWAQAEALANAQAEADVPPAIDTRQHQFLIEHGEPTCL